MAFVDYIELMSAAGGNAENDPFAEPLNREVLDDYDFSRIVSSCRGILNLVAKPFLKLGNIPLKLSDEPLIGDFGYNVRPPQNYDDPQNYDEWYRFLRAYLGALTDAFGGGRGQLMALRCFYGIRKSRLLYSRRQYSARKAPRTIRNRAAG